MSGLFSALSRASANLFNPRMLWLWSWPMLVSAIFWWLIGMLLWTPLSGWVLTIIPADTLQNWLESSRLQVIADSVESIINVIIFVTLAITTSLVITALVTMPALVNFVAKRYYPDLARMQGGTITGSLRNVISAIVIFFTLWIVTIPLWFTGIGLLAPLLAAAYLNQRLFFYDALSEHANSTELDKLFSTDRPARWSLGLLTGLFQFVPFLNFFAPTLTALAFTHFELGRLAKLRHTAA
ncbi:EI24 domain-containing protein [Nitrosomonas sp. H1_AOB3]|uniref:EI24 domain-containing protein n=1 Tax=Nitrosomonas sp. H1_AOB3 TaxID=2741553 RepID=UPI001936F0A0|nr:EI24 domain-containing protein [Nitrosomonas sp. H1_AOB3]MDL1864885.1 EI24 domain-containing protein [Betaproteobacteria bacterium PRO5]QOJ09850.1 MAG: EI24 domain-containing protein [Nitrosomonas sp. H1_AOB3]